VIRWQAENTPAYLKMRRGEKENGRKLARTTNLSELGGGELEYTYLNMYKNQTMARRKIEESLLEKPLPLIIPRRSKLTILIQK